MTEAARFTLRPARAFDAPDCAALLNGWIDETPWLPRVHAPEQIIDRYRERLEGGGRIVTVADIGGEVAGFLALHPEAGEITSLFVGPRGRGIGKALLDEAKARGGKLTLWTFQQNHAARRFYEREGFAETNRSAGDNEERLPDVQYTWAPA